MLSFLMVVIYVQKSWIDLIGEMAKRLHFHSEGDACVALVGRKIDVVRPFVYAEIVAAANEENRKGVIPVHIPASFIVGMFDLTETEEAYGFSRPTKKANR